MHAMLQSQPPQEVLNYYVHGNPFVHRDASPAEYTLGDMRTAYATRLAVNNQYQRHKPEPQFNQPVQSHHTYLSIHNHNYAPTPFPPHQAPLHSFHHGFPPGPQMNHHYHDPRQFTQPPVQHTYHPTLQYTPPARTPPTPALTEDQRSAAASPERPDLYGHPTPDAARMVHAALTHSANTRAWQPPRFTLGYEYEEPQEPVYIQSLEPGVGPGGHVLGGHNTRFRQQPPLLPFTPEHTPTWDTARVAPQYSADPQALVMPTGRSPPGGMWAPQAKGPKVGPSGHVLGGGTSRKDDASSPEVFYDTSRSDGGHQNSTALSHDIASRPVAGSATRPRSSSLRAELTLAGAPTPVQTQLPSRTRPRALSRISSMNLRNELDPVVEEEEPVPSPRLTSRELKLQRSFPVCEDDDVEDPSADLAVSERSSSSSSVSSEGAQPLTPKDDFAMVAPHIVMASLNPTAEDILYYDERQIVVSSVDKNEPIVNLPKALPAKPLSRKAQRRAARR